MYNGDAAATGGSVSYASPTLTWTGNLSPGNTVTVTFSVTVDNPDTDGKVIVTTVTSSATGSSCPTGTTVSPCRNSVGVLTPGLTITNTANSGTAVAGATVSYTVTITDSGQTPYSGATVADDLTGVLDDAAYNSDASATAGSVSYASPTLTWTGSLNPGDSATVTFSVTVNNPDTGNKILSSTVTSAAAGANCASGSTDALCVDGDGVLAGDLEHGECADRDPGLGRAVHGRVHEYGQDAVQRHHGGHGRDRRLR